MTVGFLILGALLMVLAYFHAASVMGRYSFLLSWWERNGAPIQWYLGAALIAGAGLAAILRDVLR